MSTGMDAAALDNLEAQQLQLEETLAKLRKSFQHWQTLEIDYEGLKEEFQTLPENTKRDDCLKAAQDFGAELVDEKELETLFEHNGRHRKLYQVVEILTKRIDYIARNVATVRKQLSDAEMKRNSLLLEADSEHHEAAGLPLTEITEELDDDGNVLSSKLQTPANTAPQLMEALKKAGVHDIVDGEDTAATAEVTSSMPKAGAMEHESLMIDEYDASNTTEPAIEQILGQNDKEPVSTVIPAIKNGIPSIRSSNARVGPHEGLEKDLSGPAIVPRHPDDTEEDNILRQEMLEYGLGEVGAIVAELDLEENVSIESYEDDADSLLVGSDFDDDGNDEEEESSDDEKGMAKYPVISESYRLRMEELEKRLGIQGLQNLGPKPDLPKYVSEQLDRPPAAEAARQAALARAEAASAEVASKDGPDRAEKTKKKVAFADVLDIAPVNEPRTSNSAPNITNPERKTTRPIGENIVERVAAAAPTVPMSALSSANKKMSRFKSARVEPQQAPYSVSNASDTGNINDKGRKSDPGKVIADTLVERPANKKHSRAAPPDSGDIDEVLHRREIAVEYHKRRNTIIQQQGGFVGDGEDDNYGEATAPLPVEDEITGEVKKVSRFKAARMK